MAEIAIKSYGSMFHVFGNLCLGKPPKYLFSSFNAVIGPLPSKLITMRTPATLPPL